MRKQEEMRGSAADAKLGSFRKNSKTNLKQQQRYQNQQLQFI